MIIAVTGSSRHDDTGLIWSALDRYLDDVDAVVHGSGPGAESSAGAWARRRGVCEILVPAQWARHGTRAGAIRDRWIIDYVRPDLVLAFPVADSVGTWHTVRAAQAAGITVDVVEPGMEVIDDPGDAESSSMHSRSGER